MNPLLMAILQQANNYRVVVVNWANIYTYTTNAVASTITKWIGAAINTKPTLPNTIESLPVVCNNNSTFRANTVLTECYIENSVTFPIVGNASNMFSECISLTTVNAMPENTTRMDQTFYNCRNLVNAPIIPANVTNMSYTFMSCTNLVNAPTIGANVTDMSYTFMSCTNLAGNITLINTSVANMTNMFYGCNASITKTLRCPTGSATYNLAVNVVHGKNGVTVVAY